MRFGCRLDVFLRLGVTRSLNKGRPGVFAYSRLLQVALSCIVGATRSKFYGNGRLLPSRCQKACCGKVGSFDHLLGCTGVGTINENDKKDDEKIYAFLEALVCHAYTLNPNFPIPVRVGEPGEMELCEVDHETGSASDESEGVLCCEMNEQSSWAR